MASYCYVRVSTDGQNFDPQTQDLIKKYPRAQIITEIASGAKARPMLAALFVLSHNFPTRKSYTPLTKS